MVRSYQFKTSLITDRVFLEPCAVWLAQTQEKQNQNLV